MANELIVSSTPEGLRIAVLEDKRLVELHFEKQNNLFTVGDVFLGRVSRVNHQMNAAFVEIGHPKDGFLQYYDLGPQIKTQTKFLNAAIHQRQLVPIDQVEGVPDIDKGGKMADVLKPGQTVLVQIMKEAISTKGPRLSSQLSLAGQYIILMPFSSDVSVSRKFRSRDEKRRVKQLLDDMLPPNVGIIVRTAAEGVELEKIREEFTRLMARWQSLCEQVVGGQAPRKVLSEMDRAQSLLRDMLAIGFDAIYVDDKALFGDIQDYLRTNLPDKVDILELKKPRVGLFEHFGIERQIKSSFGRNVNMPGGSYIVVEHTEALHVIDVNSGSQRNTGQSAPEENALRTNLEAASEIARQLRLRDMGGIIVIDFIDHRRPEHRKAVFDKLRDEMRRDRARHTILPMSKFGLIQITRQRVRPEVTISTDETCPSCGGTGKIEASIAIVDNLERNLAYLIEKSSIKKLHLEVNPYLAAYLKQGLPSRRFRWWQKYRRWIGVKSSDTLPFTTVRYLDGMGEEIKLD